MPGRGAKERHWLKFQAKLAAKDAANGRASSQTMCVVNVTSPAKQQHCSQHYQTGKQPPPPPVVPHDVSAVIRETKAEPATARLQIKEYAQKLEILQQQSEEALKIKAKDIQQEAELETATALQTLRTQAEESRHFMMKQLYDEYQQELNQEREELHRQEDADKNDWRQSHHRDVMREVGQVRRQEQEDAATKLEEVRRQVAHEAAQKTETFRRELSALYASKHVMLDSQRELLEQKQKLQEASWKEVLHQKRYFDEQEQLKNKKDIAKQKNSLVCNSFRRRGRPSVTHDNNCLACCFFCIARVCLKMLNTCTELWFACCSVISDADSTKICRSL